MMTPAQTALYFREWAAVRKHYRDQGIDPAQCDARRHQLHKKALGAMKSSKAFTNSDLDKVLAVFWSITRPGDLNTQLRQQDQVEIRLRNLRGQLLTLAQQAGIKPGLESGYVVGIAAKVFHGVEYGRLDEKQLAQIAGILRAQIKRHERDSEAMFPKQQPGVFSAAVKAEDGGNPF